MKYKREMASFWKRGIIPKKGSRDKDTERHEEPTNTEKLSREARTLTKTTSVKKAAEEMLKQGKRTITIVESGNKKIEGVIRATDILSLFGGGEKSNIVEKRFNGNIVEALNMPVRKIMEQEARSKGSKANLNQIIEELRDSGTDTVPITRKDKYIGEITERRMLNMVENAPTGQSVKDVMTEEVITGGVGYKIGDTCRIMVKNNVHRLPVIEKHTLEGITTYSDLLRYFSKEVFTLTKTNMEHEAFNVIIENIMTNSPVTAGPKQPLNRAITKMKETGHGALPVTQDGDLKGILTRTDIMKEIKWPR